MFASPADQYLLVYMCNSEYVHVLIRAQPSPHIGWLIQASVAGWMSNRYVCSYRMLYSLVNSHTAIENGLKWQFIYLFKDIAKDCGFPMFSIAMSIWQRLYHWIPASTANHPMIFAMRRRCCETSGRLPWRLWVGSHLDGLEIPSREHI